MYDLVTREQISSSINDFSPNMYTALEVSMLSLIFTRNSSLLMPEKLMTVFEMFFFMICGSKCGSYLCLWYLFP